MISGWGSARNWKDCDTAAFLVAFFKCQGGKYLQFSQCFPDIFKYRRQEEYIDWLLDKVSNIFFSSNFQILVAGGIYWRSLDKLIQSEDMAGHQLVRARHAFSLSLNLDTWKWFTNSLRNRENIWSGCCLGIYQRSRFCYIMGVRCCPTTSTT